MADVTEGLTPPPAVFRGLWRRADREKGFSDSGSAGQLAAAISAVVGRTADDGEVAVLRSMAASLPPRGRLTWLGAMPAREPRTLRALVQGFGADGLADNLRQIGWPGSADAVLPVLQVMGNQRAGLGVQLDITGGGLLPRVGIEVSPPVEGQSGETASGAAATGGLFWPGLLASLEEAGWALPSKSRGLLQFPGREYVIGDGIFEVRKEINHVKISIEEGPAYQAKAYGRMLCRPVEP